MTVTPILRCTGSTAGTGQLTCTAAAVPVNPAQNTNVDIVVDSATGATAQAVFHYDT